MTKSTIALFAVLLLGFPLAAQEKLEAPKPNRRVFIIGTVALAGTTAYDGFATHNLLNRGGWENNPILGKHPTVSRQSGIQAAFFGIDAATFYFTEHNRRKFIRWAGRAYIAFSIYNHVRMGACDSRINVLSPHPQNCHPL